MTEIDVFARCAGGDDGLEYPNRPGQFLVVANFLSKFSRHLLPYSDDVKAENIGNITLRDLEDALEYRSLLDDLDDAEDNRFVVEEYGSNSATLQPVSSRLILKEKAQIDRLKGEIEMVADRTKIIHLLLERLEVWSTKYLSQDFLLSSTKCLFEDSGGETNQCCFSPLLNLPAAAYFASRMPVVSTKDDQAPGSPTSPDDSLGNLSAFHRPNKEIGCCSLAIPPNRHTWKAYARISSLVSLLEDPLYLERAFRSPCAEYDLLKAKKGQHSASYGRQYSFTAPSLVALWVRAQRNTRALRQLWMLFEVQRAKKDQGRTNLESSHGSETTTDKERERQNEFLSVPGVSSPRCGWQLTMTGNEALDDERGTTGQYGRTSIANTAGNHHRECSFRAILRGNPLHAKYRVVDVGRGVDQLVEWTVVNQSLYTYSRIKRDLLTEPQRQERHKRKRLRELYSHSHAKRIRSEGNPDTALKELNRACQSFILRWFARRNRKTLSVLFSNGSKSLVLDIGCAVDPKVCSKVRELQSADVVGEFHKIFAQCSAGVAHAQDRSFAIVDKNLATTGKYDESSGVTFRSHMLALLDSFIAACPGKNVDPMTLATVRQDFITLHDHFLPPGEVDVLKTASSLVQLSTGISTDFLDIIKAIPTPWPQACYVCEADYPTLRTCRNCECVFHENCSPGCTVVNFKDILRSFPLLLDLCLLKKPTNLERPDFSNSGSVEWKKEEIIFERSLGPNGLVEPFGVCLQPLDECRIAYDILDSDLSSLLDLISMDEQDTGNNKPQVPVAVDNLGCLVTSVQKGMVGDRFDLKESDIITRLELLEFINADDRERYGSQIFEMNKISSEERMTVLKVQSSRLKITLLRPSINLVEVAVAWYKGIRKLNMKMLEAFRLHGSLWYCGSCAGQDELEAGESNQIFREAQCCRAVIRRLGMESYSLPFIDETRGDVDVNFSLRRLDSMMTHLMHTHSKDKKFEHASEAFLASSWTDKGRERVPWATKVLERRPMELLCNAVKFAMSSSFSGVADLNSQRSSLLAHFLVAFSSWCVGGTMKSDVFRGTKGPPPSLKHLRPPWLGASCSVCFSRPVVGDEVTCSSDFCRNNVRDMGIEDVGDEDILPAGDATDEYVRLASFVGTTFLVLPTDPLVKSVSEYVRIDHQDRPVEFVVASYLPPSFNEEATRGRPKDATDRFRECDGIFHLLPVVNADQQLFLLERAQVRDISEKNSSGKAWASLDLLNLGGVARYSPSELQTKIEESMAMRIAIEDAIVQQVRLMVRPPSSSMDIKNVTNLDDLAHALSSTASNRNLNVQIGMLEGLLRGKASSELIRSLVSEESDADVDQIGDVVANDASGMDDVGKDPEETSGHMFGSSSLQPGLPIVLNPVKTLKKILPLRDNSCCLIYYSDLQFELEAAKIDLQESLVPQDLHQHHLPPTNESVLSIVLSPSNDSNIGWGFELVRWSNEGCVRIGRVQKNSTAFTAGLKPHDKIESVNGMRLGKFGSQCEFILAVLGVRNTRVRTSRMLGIEEISQVVSTIKKAGLEISKVYLVISRPCFADGECDQSLDTIPDTQQQVPLHFNAQNPECRAAAKKSLVRDRNEVQGEASAATRLPLEIYEDTAPRHGTMQPTVGSRASQHQMVSRRDAKIANLLRETAHLRHPISASDFYQPALQGTILTRLEVAVFLHAVLNNHWKLGVRLLMPRYELNTVIAQVKTILSWTQQQFTSIPVLSPSIYDRILGLDYERMKCSIYPETGDFVLEERNRGQTYRYRLPRRPLPIDSVIQSYDEEHLDNFTQQNRNYQPPSSRREWSYPGRSPINNSDNRQQRHNVDVVWREEESSHYVSRDREQFRIENGGHGEVINLLDDAGDRPVFNFDDSDMPHHETSAPGPPQVGNFNYTSIPLNPVHDSDSPARIRGGGENGVGGLEEHGNSEVCLLDIPLEEWNGKAVCYDFAAATKDGTEEAYLIGFVRLPIDWNSQSSSVPEKVDVEAHYVSTIGYLERTVEYNLDTDEIYAVDIESGNAEARVVATLLSEKKYLPNTNLTVTSETQEEYSQNAGPPAAGVVLNQDVDIESGNAEAKVVATLLSEKKSLPETNSTDTCETQEDYSQNSGPPAAGVVLNQDVDIESGNAEAKVVTMLLSEKKSLPETNLTETSETQEDYSQNAGPPAAGVVLNQDIDIESGNAEARVVAMLLPEKESLPETNLTETSETQEDYSQNSGPPAAGVALNQEVDIESGNTKARVVAALLSEKKSLPETNSTETSETQEDYSQNAGPPAACVVLIQETDEDFCPKVFRPVVQPTRREDEEDRIEEMSVEFSVRLTDLELLGTLPDGSDVFWVSNDPANVFIDESPREQMLESSQTRYLGCLHRAQAFGPDVDCLCVNETDKLYCVWGCSVLNPTSDERHPLAFESFNDLNIHYTKFHTVTTRMKEVVLGQRKILLQSQEGQAIVDLARGLTSAICARFPLLLEEVHQEDFSLRRMGGTTFFKSPTSSILNFPVNVQVMKRACELRRSSSSQASGIRSLLHLWSRLARLYHCDTTGHLRLSHDEFRPLSVRLWTRSSDRPNVHFRIDEEKTLASSTKTTCTFVHSCRLCSLPFEKYLRYSDLPGRSDCRGNMAYSCRTIGCSLLSDAALTKKASYSGDRHIPGRLGPAKMLMLKVARLIPDSIKSKSSFGSTRSSTSERVDAIYSHRIFDGNNFGTWKAFVLEVKTTRMLAQAFVTLLASINRTKLPSWWRRASGGWSTASMVMSESSLSTLYLHIYVFDAALSELIAGSLHSAKGEHVEKFSPGSKREYERYWEKAISLGFEPFKGDSENYCYHCEEGGTLLCCDLCPNVQHYECVDPPLSPDVSLDHWICDSCLHDIDNFDGV